MGIINAFAYLGSSLQSVCLGYLVPDKQGAVIQTVPLLGFACNWEWLPVFVIPFAVIGLIIAIKIWYELPEATQKIYCAGGGKSSAAGGVNYSYRSESIGSRLAAFQAG